ncbi:MAG: hypothetical protein ACRDOB_15670, partial [Streptosporangiaceae bacterium]
MLKSRFHYARYGRGVLTRWQSGLAAIVVTLGTATLVILDLADAGVRAWGSQPRDHDRDGGGAARAADHGASGRSGGEPQAAQRPCRAIAAQAAIVVTQARRTSQAVSQAIFADDAQDDRDAQGDRDAAVDEFRTYMIMMLLAAPVLID